jgi:hypothetical protein
MPKLRSLLPTVGKKRKRESGQQRLAMYDVLKNTYETVVKLASEEPSGRPRLLLQRAARLLQPQRCAIAASNNATL